MVFPLSVGEAALLAKIAWTLGQVFARAGKSVPAEFREVENQLYSLSAALAAVSDAHTSGGLSGPFDPTKTATESQCDEPTEIKKNTVGVILRSCQQALKHLEELVDKYGIIVAQADREKPRLKRWSRYLIKNYRRIAWTLEDGDLATLRSQLMVHTGSLQLILSSSVNSRASKLQEGLQENTGMLKDIHQWWEKNLKTSGPITSKRNVAIATKEVTLTRNSTPSTLSFASFTFQVNFEKGGDLELVCPVSSLLKDWERSKSGGIFVCRCGPQPGSLAAKGARHEVTLKGITLSPLSLAFRRAGGGIPSWTLFKVMDLSHSHRLVSVIITNVPTDEISTFEEFFVQPLSDAKARHMLAQGTENMLTYTDPHTNQPLVLNIYGLLGNLYQQVESVVLNAGHRYLTQRSVSGLSLLHYRALGTGDRKESGFTPVLCDHAELHVYFEEEQGHPISDPMRTQTTKILFHLKHNMNLKIMEGASPRVVLEGINCIGYRTADLKEEETKQIEQVDVSFYMTTVQSARLLYQRINDMRAELAAMTNRGADSPHDMNLPFRARVTAVEEAGPEGEASIADPEDGEDSIS